MSSPTLAALKVRNYRLFAAGQLISNTGTWMQRIAQDWLVLQLTHNSGLALGITSMLQALPMLFFGMWGGVVADHHSKRAILINTQAAMGALAAILATLTLTGVVQTWQVYLLALGLGLATVLDQPARQSFTIEMVGKEHLSAAVAVNSITFNSARVIGPGLAGFAIGWLGMGPMFLLNAASYIAVLVGLVAMRPRELHLSDRPARGKGQARAGLAYVGSRVELLLPVVVIGIVSAFGQSFQVILPLLAKQNFHQQASGYGVLTAGLAAGSVFGAVYATRRKNPRVAVVLGAAVTFGVFEAFSGLSGHYWLCFAVLIPAGVAALTLNTSANASVQLGSEPGMRGRAMALYMLVLLSANSLGSLILGALAQAVGPGPAIAIGGLAVIAATALAALALAALYKIPLTGLLALTATSSQDSPPHAASPVPSAPPSTTGESSPLADAASRADAAPIDPTASADTPQPAIASSEPVGVAESGEGVPTSGPGGRISDAGSRPR